MGRRHKTVAERARRMIACLRRWLPGIALTVVGDSAYSVIELGLSCRRRDVRLIAPLRLDARLFTQAPPRQPGQIGRPRVAGDRLPNLDVVLADPGTPWATVAVRWYDGAERRLEVTSGTVVWYHNGMEPLPIRWVLTRDPAGRMEPRCYFSTRPEDEAARVVSEFVKRWPIEVTFEEARAHLGVSHVLIPRRDRLARPDDPIDGMRLENLLREAGLTLVFMDRVVSPLERGRRRDVGELITAMLDYNNAGEFRRELAQKMVYSQMALAKAGFPSPEVFSGHFSGS